MQASMCRLRLVALASTTVATVAEEAVRQRSKRCPQEPTVLCEQRPAPRLHRAGWVTARRECHKSEKLIKHTDFIYTCICRGKLADSYLLEKELGCGSFGTVYLGRHKCLGYLRAVKKVQKIPEDPKHMESLMNEVHALMDLDHPNVVKLVRYYDEGHCLYLVFELCEGPDLFERIRGAMRSPEGRMTEAEAAAALCQMLKALKCCHCNYMGHFDVKPENFMYSTRDFTTLKMIDLGLSSGFKRDKKEIRGTAEYMAPEIWDGLYGPEADIWSCGVVLFAMLTGQTFLPSRSPDEELRHMVRDRAWVRQRLRWANKRGLSQDAQHLLAAMLRHDRHLRPTVREALWHPFLARCDIKDHFPREDVEKASIILNGLLEGCKAFSAEPVLKRAVLLLMAHIGGCAAKDAQAHKLAFALIDRNSDGELSIEAIEEHYLRETGSIPENLEEAISGVDINDDGYITYVEFLSANLPPSMGNCEILWRVCFNLIDFGKDGHIDASDLAVAFQHGADRDNICKAALAEVCSGGRLSWEQFRQLMQRTDASTQIEL